jgi:hypothetical protein
LLFEELLLSKLDSNLDLITGSLKVYDYKKVDSLCFGVKVKVGSKSP